MAGCTALSITMKSHKDRCSKSVSGQEIPPHRLKDHRLPLLVITNNQEYSPLSSAAMSAALRSPSRGGRVRATCSKTWDGGPHGSHEGNLREEGDDLHSAALMEAMSTAGLPHRGQTIGSTS